MIVRFLPDAPLDRATTEFVFIDGVPFVNSYKHEEVVSRHASDRDRWIRLFNRLEAAVSHHIKAKAEGAFNDDADDALHRAHAKVLSAAAQRGRS